MRDFQRCAARIKAKERRLKRVIKDDGARRPKIGERCARLLRKAMLERAALIGEG